MFDTNVSCNEWTIAALQLAALSGSFDSVKLLLECGAAVNQDCTTSALFRASQASNAGSVRLLLNAGAKVDVADIDGWTPLHFACFVGTADSVRSLLQAGAQVDRRTSDGSTPLHQACATGDAEKVRLLLDAGADGRLEEEPDWLLRESRGKRAVEVARKYGHPVCVALLEQAGFG